MISVLVVTYNHEQWIDRALASVHRQSGIGKVEIVVADDASNDDTLHMVERWKNRLNLRILPTEPNMGITRNYQRGFAATQGDLVAVLEGDDEWSHPRKLKRQARAMRDKSLSMCATRTLMITNGGEQEEVLPYPLSSRRRFSAEELAGGNAFSTFSACMYRKTALEHINPEVYSLTAYDWLINLLVTETGEGLLLPEVMTTYHRHSAGVWSQKTQTERDRQVINLIPQYQRFLRPSVAEEVGRLRSYLIDNL